MNGTQRKHLNERLTTAVRLKERQHYRHRDKVTPDTPLTVVRAQRMVKSLQKVINAWDQKQAVKRGVVNEQINKAARTVREAILFGDANEALKALHVFEARKFE